MKKFWDWIDKRRYGAFDKSLDQAERWRNKRAPKDGKKWGGFSKKYDDRLQNHYLNFQTNRFQRTLTIISIIGMLLSGIIGGWVVYKLTDEDKAYIVISRPILNHDERTLNISVTNLKNYPAFDVVTYYDLIGSSIDARFKHIGRFPSLFKETKKLNLNLSELDLLITQEASRWFFNYYRENNSVGILQNQEYYVRGLGFENDYQIQINSFCDNCEIQAPEPLDYTPSIYCRIEKENTWDATKCNIQGSSGL